MIVTSSYIGSLCLSPPAPFETASIFALLLLMLIIITVVKTITLIIKAVAKELMDMMYTVLIAVFAMPNASVVSESRVLWFSVSCKSSLCVIRIGLLIFPALFPQQTVCTANMHMLPLVGTSVQRTVVWLVVVGQLPQFDARML